MIFYGVGMAVQFDWITVQSQISSPVKIKFFSKSPWCATVHIDKLLNGWPATYWSEFAKNEQNRLTLLWTCLVEKGFVFSSFVNSKSSVGVSFGKTWLNLGKDVHFTCPNTDEKSSLEHCLFFFSSLFYNKCHLLNFWGIIRKFGSAAAVSRISPCKLLKDTV